MLQKIAFGYFVLGIVQGVLADGLIYRYEGDVLPYDPSAGWIIGNPCDDRCQERIDNGHFVLEWRPAGGSAYYIYRIAQPPVPPPASLWVEWRYRSDTPFPGTSITCDGMFSIDYRSVVEPVFMFGDAVFSFSGDDYLLGLDLGEFETLRFQSLDGGHFSFSVDGVVFETGFSDDQDNGSHSLLFVGDGGCTPVPVVQNEWDFIRYGTIGEGEAIVASDPPGGILDAGLYPSLDRFTVTFDQPNYVYLDDVTVEVSGGDTPIVTKTRRLDNGAPEVVEIVLERPLSVGQTTRFTFNTGGTPNVVEYTLVQFGACCLPDGACEVRNELDCADRQGVFHSGEGCPAASACCLADGVCAEVAPLCCVEVGSIPGLPGAVCDHDPDGDQVDAACGDACPDDPEKTASGLCGCGVSDVDTDADTVPDCRDQCPNADDRVDADGNGEPDCALGLLRIPTASAWGLTILALALLIAAKITFSRPTSTAK